MALILFGIVYKPIPKAIQISTTPGTFSSECTKELVTCTSDTECRRVCQEQSEGKEMSCQELSRTTPTQKTIYGPSQKVCAPTNATMDCNQKLGGLLTWTGWGGLPVMDWECICSYPAYASTEGCKQINPNICGGSKNATGFKWDVSTGRDPQYTDCTCPAGTTRIISPEQGDKPMCVPSTLTSWYMDTDQVK